LKPAPSQKASAPGGPAPQSAPEQEAVVSAVKAWAEAWSRKDADAYLGFYAKDFRTPKGEPRAAWEKARRERLLAPRSIAVTVTEPRVSQREDGRASVTFRQEYKSDRLSSRSTKTLLMVKAEGGRWLIQQEQVAH
jgi:ketosteroid isomerase-like protein